MPEYSFCSHSQCICPGICFTIHNGPQGSVMLYYSQCILTILKHGHVHINEHGQIVVTAATTYSIGAFYMCIHESQLQRSFRYSQWSPLEESLSSQINQWSSSLTLQKDSLCNAYDAIKDTIRFQICEPFDPQDTLYAPGSVLTSCGTLVGRVPIILNEWVVKWKGPKLDSYTRLLLSSTHKSIAILILYFLANCSLTVVQ